MITTGNKIQPQHMAKIAYIYLRQSTLTQVRFNQESTQRQYALQNKAIQLGWSEHAIKILDGDLGLSGTQIELRQDFKLLAADVSMGKVGAVFALEASRLSRSCTDWHRLLELCALTHTLIIDEDGCYDPADFNDQLLLGLKGTMSQAELHFIRARLQGGKLNKAKKGELRTPLPVGFCYDEENRIIFDTDEQVCHIMKLFFKIFKEKGAAYGVSYYFNQHHIQFPARVPGGIWKDKLVWRSLTRSRALAILKNPCYAGTYAYGRRQYQKKLSSTGELQVAKKYLPIKDWCVMLNEHHEAYITWEDYLENQKILEQNQTNTPENMSSATAREGFALLQGLLICNICGHRLTVCYKGRHGNIQPTYRCILENQSELPVTTCTSVQANNLDKAISQRILEIMNTVQVDIAIKAFEEVETRTQMLSKQWQMKIDRANYEAQLAQRRYEEVDPSNRLVAVTLEKRWNEALIDLEEIRTQYAEHQKKNNVSSTQQQKNDLFLLAQNFPELWNSESTSMKDRKRILRLLIKDISIEKPKDGKIVILHIRWQGGATENMEVEISPKNADKWRHPAELIEQVKHLSLSLTDEQIVNVFNQEKMKTNKGNPFTINAIKWIRCKHKIPSMQLQKIGKLSIKEVSKKFNVNKHVVYYWIDRGIINAQRINSKFWVTIEQEKEIELRKRVEKSAKTFIARSKCQNKIVGDTV